MRLKSIFNTINRTKNAAAAAAAAFLAGRQVPRGNERLRKNKTWKKKPINDTKWKTKKNRSDAVRIPIELKKNFSRSKTSWTNDRFESENHRNSR